MHNKEIFRSARHMLPDSNTSDPACRLFIGTSGYSYPEWTAYGFYPPGTAGKDMLAHYSRRFNAIEINYTWYQMPKAFSMERMLARVPQGFAFSVKLTRTMTHAVDPKNWRQEAEKFRQGIAPLVQGRTLLAVLIQFGPSFERTRENRLYLAHLIDELPGLPLAVEFRHRSWNDDRVFIGLQERKVALVALDAPDLPQLFPTQAIVTNPDLFYVRFHGRNAKGWRTTNMQHKFDYGYSHEELQPWSAQRIPEMAEQAKSGAIFFNNHVRGQAPQNAAMLMEQLAGQGFSIKLFHK